MNEKEIEYAVTLLVSLPDDMLLALKKTVRDVLKENLPSYQSGMLTIWLNWINAEIEQRNKPTKKQSSKPTKQEPVVWTAKNDTNIKN